MACVALAIVATYVVTRVVLIARFPYFLDEGTYAVFADKGAHATSGLFSSFSIGREPLMFWLAIPWIKLGVMPLVAVRIVSALAGFATLVVVGLLGRRLGGTTVGLLAAALCVVAPFLLVHDGIGIIEPMVTLVMAAALYVQVEFARRPGWRLAALLGLVFAAGLLTKENTKPAIVLLPLSLLCFDWSASGRRDRLVRWFGGVALSALFAVGAILVLHSSSRYPEYQKARDQPLLYTVRTVHDVLKDPFASVGHSWHIYRPALVGYLTIPLLAAALAGLLIGLGRRTSRRLTTLIALWILVPLAVSLVFSALPYPRHVMYLVPPLLVLMAFGLVETGRSFLAARPSRPAAAFAAVIAALMLTPALLLDARVLAHPATTRYPGADDLQYVTGTGAGSIWPAVADTIRRRARGRDVYLLTTRSYPQVIEFVLGDRSRYHFVTGRSPLAARAQFSLDDPIPFYDPDAAKITREGHFVAVGRYPRPRHGATLVLSQRP